MPDTTVGIIGLGLMGAPIAQHLVDAGYAVLGYDLDLARLDAAAALGVTRASDLDEVIARTSTILTLLPTSDAVRSVCAAIVAAEGSHTVVEMSTAPVEVKLAVANEVRRAGKTLLDCPVIGTSAQAHDKDIVVCASGPRAAVESLREVFSAFAHRCEYLGDVGTGSRMKLVANLLVQVHNAAAAEALTLAQAAGLDPETALRVLVGTGAGSRQLELRGPSMAAHDYDAPTATIATFNKDAQAITDLSRSLRCSIPLHSTAAGLYLAAAALGGEDSDCSSVARVYATLAPTNERHI